MEEDELHRSHQNDGRSSGVDLICYTDGAFVSKSGSSYDPICRAGCGFAVWANPDRLDNTAAGFRGITDTSCDRVVYGFGPVKLAPNPNGVWLDDEGRLCAPFLSNSAGELIAVIELLSSLGNSHASLKYSPTLHLSLKAS